MELRLNAVFFPFFTLAAYVQLNDPDAVVWMLVYIIPALLCLPELLQISNGTVDVVCKGVKLLHTLFCIILIIKTVSTWEGEFALISPISALEREEARELSGLAITIIWLNSHYFAKSSLLRKRAKLWAAVALLPILLWSVCYVKGANRYFSYCEAISSSCASQSEVTAK